VTLRDALRRSLWIAFALVIVSIIAFWGLVRYGERYRGTSEATPLRHLPVFVNAEPRNARDLALAAMRSVAQDRPDASAAKAQLVRLGGAALPHVLPAFDTLDSTGRGRVALALMPIAERMGLAGRGELTSAEAAVPFWTRFWQDRAIDYRPQVVRRVVSRIAERSFALRREDIQHLDTYAMSAVIAELGSVETSEDVARVRRLTGILEHVTGLPWRAERGASPESTRKLVERWHTFWDEQGADFSTLDGPRRVTAMVTETRYAKWLSAAGRGGLGRTHDGRTAFEHVREHSRGTLAAVLAILVLGTTLSLIWTRLEELDTLHRSTRLALSAVGITFASLPLPALYGVRGGYAFIVLAGALSGGALISRYVRATHRLADDNAGTGRLRLRTLLAASGPTIGLHASLAISGLIALEIAFGLPGLGASAVAALRAHDVNAWMAEALSIALSLLLVRHISDVVFAATSGTPRVFLDEDQAAS
jgi:hypothetical protein